MKTLLMTAALAVAALASAAHAKPVPGRPHVDDSSLVQPDGQRILRESIVIAAPRDKVWSAWASSEGLKSWEAPVAAIDLRVGGYLEATYDPKGHLGDPNNIKHEVLSYVPGELLVFRNVQAPHGFPHADLFSHVSTVIQLEDAGPGKTRVTVSGVGYGAGQDWDQLYGFFHAGNAYLLEMLKAHFEGGPGPDGDAHSEAKAKG
jgi:uncharacterized protein YndB with AHSA1/START domain